MQQQIINTQCHTGKPKADRAMLIYWVKKRIQHKIHHLRQQPEHIRLRAASMTTIIAGGVIVVLWLVVFLPLQLHFAPGRPTQSPAPQPVAGQAGNTISPSYTPVPQVAGTQTPAASSAPSFTTTPVLSIPPASPTSIPEASTQPVSITE